MLNKTNLIIGRFLREKVPFCTWSWYLIEEPKTEEWNIDDSKVFVIRWEREKKHNRLWFRWYCIRSTRCCLKTTKRAVAVFKFTKRWTKNTEIWPSLSFTQKRHKNKRKRTQKKKISVTKTLGLQCALTTVYLGWQIDKMIYIRDNKEKTRNCRRNMNEG